MASESKGNATALVLSRHDASAARRQGGREGRGGAFYTASLSLGDPTQTYELLVDTGSTVTFASCIWCQHCGGSVKMNPRESETAEWIRCEGHGDLDLDEILHGQSEFRRHIEEGWMLDSEGSIALEEELSRDLQALSNSSSCVGSMNHAECQGDFCHYRLEYLDGSATGGRVLRDIMPLTSGGFSWINIGCAEFENRNVAMIEQIDGLIGMAPVPGTPPQQLQRSGTFSSPSFSMCYGRTKANGGILLMGDWEKESVQRYFSGQLHYSRMSKTSAAASKRFVIHPQALWLGDTQIGDQKLLSEGIYNGLMMDSGSAFTRMVPLLLYAFQQAMLSHVKKTSGTVRIAAVRPKIFQGVSSTQDSLCFQVDSSVPFQSVLGLFPNLTFAMPDGWRLNLDPSRYMFHLEEEEVDKGLLSRNIIENHGENRLQMDSSNVGNQSQLITAFHKGAWCTGIRVHHQTGSTLGAPAMAGMYIHYDTANSRVGFADADCRELRQHILQANLSSQPEHSPLLEGSTTEQKPLLVHPLPKTDDSRTVAAFFLVLLAGTIVLAGLVCPWMTQNLRRRVRYTALGRAIEIPHNVRRVSHPNTTT